MSYCRKCGKELGDTENYCGNCGTKVEGLALSDVVSSIKRGSMQLAGNVSQNVQGSNSVEANSTSTGIAATKQLGLITAILFIVNFLMTFCDTIEISFFELSRSGSLIEICKTLNEFGALDDYPYVIPILTLSVGMIAVSAFLSLLPILFNYTYKRWYLLINCVSAALAFIIYLIVAIALATSGYSENTYFTAIGYLYIVESLVALICTVKLLNALSLSTDSIEPFVCDLCEQPITTGHKNIVRDHSGNEWKYCDNCYNTFLEVNQNS